jgi:prefoldin subunit 5
MTRVELRASVLQEINRTIEHLKFQAESFTQSLAHVEYFVDTLKGLVESLEKSTDEKKVPPTTGG